VLACFVADMLPFVASVEGDCGKRLVDAANIICGPRLVFQEGLLAMNKDLATEIIDRLEELHLENLAMLAYINGIHRLNPKAPTASQLIEAKLQSSESVAAAKRVFAPLRAAIQEDQGWESLLKAYLEIFPVDMDEN
jgi:hypothetical protein